MNITDAQRRILEELIDTPIPETRQWYSEIERDLEILETRGIVECESICGVQTDGAEFSVDVWTLTRRGHGIAERHGIMSQMLASDADMEADMLLATQAWK